MKGSSEKRLSFRSLSRKRALFFRVPFDQRPAIRERLPIEASVFVWHAFFLAFFFDCTSAWTKGMQNSACMHSRTYARALAPTYPPTHPHTHTRTRRTRTHARTHAHTHTQAGGVWHQRFIASRHVGFISDRAHFSYFTLFLYLPLTSSSCFTLSGIVCVFGAGGGRRGGGPHTNTHTYAAYLSHIHAHETHIHAHIQIYMRTKTRTRNAIALRVRV